jgi:5-hydroxyisourate hydrolase-like protein (transthyretin family)
MTQKHILTSLTLLIFLALAGGQVLQSQAAALPEAEAPPKIDQAVWEAIAASPTREVTVVVSLLTEDGGGPELAIDAQFRLEQLLDLLAERGGLSGYQAFYGANIIKVTGGLGLLRLLEDWPELESVALYQPGEAWELGAESALRSEQINASGLIVGKVTASSGGAPLEGIRVTAYRLTGGVSWEVAGIAFTNASGDYAVSGLGTGIYRARFDDPAGNYATQFYNNKANFTLANNFNVTDSQVTPNINAAMVLAGKISGTVTKVGGGSLQDIAVSAHTDVAGTWQFVANAISASNGVYTIGSLPPGTYRVRFADIYSPPSYLVQWYSGQLVVDDAQDIYVSAGATVPGINAAMGSYGSISGNIKADDEVTNLAGITVDAYRYRSTYWEWVSVGETNASGNYVVNGLSTGDYRLEFIDTLGQFAKEFYNNKPDIGSADDIEVELGYATENINAQLSLKTNTVTNSLVSGWNLVSLPVIMDNPTTPVAFESVEGSYNEIFAYDACDTSVPFDPWKLYTPDLPPDHPANDLTEVNVKMGYWIKLSSQATLSLSGVHPLTTSINLCPGWNLIGYPSLAVRPVEEALASISGKYSLVRQYRAGESTLWRTYSTTAPPTLNTLKNMEPGYGYWIYMTEAATLVVAGR